DWLFSRQRYWGEPFPILHRDDGLIESVAESDLPVSLPEMEDFKPSASDDPNAEPQVPLARAESWTRLECNGREYRRELNTMPQWAGSCWYYLRFCDSANSQSLIDPAAEKYWMTGEKADGSPHVGGIDLYLGGAEHAVLHLLYARFWHKVLYDLGVVSTPEPFGRLFNQGMIGAAAYTDERGVYVEASKVVDEHGEPAAADSSGPFFYDGKPVTREFGKMGKSLKNVVNPDEIIAQFGADTMRLYEMSMGPLEAGKPWNTRDIVGVHRFLHRVWRLIIDRDSGKINSKIGEKRDDGLEKLLHKTIKKVTGDIESFGFNTAIAAMITWVNEATKAECVHRDQAERFVALLSPFAPHIAEELAERMGRSEPLTRAAWPTFDEALTRDDEVEMAVQIKGKLRGRITVVVGAAQDEIITAAREAVKDVLGDTPIKKAIVVPGRLVNLVV
ncbi:MAG: class I tRNA ligase family protein, partial [Planctomycetes bacterium]|nr:class I tRNA ligase family protein [Planctomycetota bacterium]